MMSPGRRSGVNWILLKSRPRVAARDWARSVFAVPGGPSSRICPPQKSAVSIRSKVSACPMIARETSLRSVSAMDLTSLTCMNDPFPPAEELARHSHHFGLSPRLCGIGPDCIEFQSARAALERLQRGFRLVARNLPSYSQGSPREIACHDRIAFGHPRLAFHHANERRCIVDQGGLAEREPRR